MGELIRGFQVTMCIFRKVFVPTFVNFLRKFIRRILDFGFSNIKPIGLLPTVQELLKADRNSVFLKFFSPSYFAHIEVLKKAWVYLVYMTTLYVSQEFYQLTKTCGLRSRLMISIIGFGRYTS